MGRIKLILIVIMAVFCLIVILQNTAAVETRLLFVTITMPRAVLLFITTVIGFLAGVLVTVHFLRNRPSPQPKEK